MDEIKTKGDIFKTDLLQFTPEQDAEIAEYERRQEEEARAERYRRTVPERYWKESLGTYRADTDERKKMADTARKFAQAVRCGQFRTLVLLGAAGTGKTHLACGIVREAGGLYRLSPAIVEEIRRAKSFSSRETEADILDGYGRASLLVVDEIGRGVAAGEEQYMLYQVINERYNRRKPTVLISNQSKGEFLSYVGVAAADRLTESASIAEFTGRSYRAQLRRTNAQ